MDNSKVSVIIPLYNTEKYIEETIDSVLNQTLEDFEIIVVDDCSTDNSYEITKKIATKDQRIMVLKNEINKGRAGTVNVGLEIAKGEYVTFLDADDLFCNNRLKEQINFLEENPSVDGAYGNMLFFEESGAETVYSSIVFKENPRDTLAKYSSMKKEDLIKIRFTSGLLNPDAFSEDFFRRS